ncbi:MAG: uracil-DNA glycosylase [Planctomycetes bacterium]|nr:uracil-DNA glycosylase [Planctomycetota bacterium]
MASSDDIEDPRAELVELSAAFRAHLRRRERLGLRRERAGVPTALPLPQTTPQPSLAPGAPRGPEPVAAGAARAPGAPPPPPRPSLRVAAPPPAPLASATATPAFDTKSRAAQAQTLAELRDAVRSCTACELCRTRTQTVFADGSGRARVMFIGEAPGEHEDQQGVPFVGAAGSLLTDIVQKGMGLAREDVYIANVLKCRPPGNRDPSELEKRLCTPFLARQIELVDPQVIIPLGRHASNYILGLEGPAARSMGALRARIHDAGARKVVPTYHPSYLLRTPEDKKECWKDIQLAMGLLGLTRK